MGHPRVTFMKPLFGGFFAMVMYCAVGANPLFGGFFAYGDGASRRNEVFVMRLFCVGFCKIGK